MCRDINSTAAADAHMKSHIDAMHCNDNVGSYIAYPHIASADANDLHSAEPATPMS